jgi:hypothetical protein
MNQADLWKMNLAIFNIGGKVKCAKYLLTRPEMFSSLKRNVELIDPDKRNKKAYVLALGPSLKDVDLNKVKGDTIVVNRFFKIGEKFPDFVPTYYMMADPLFGNPENLADFHAAIDMYASKGTIFILNSKLAKSPLLKDVDKNHLYFVTDIDGRVKVKKEYRIDKIFPAFQNVTGSAILLLMLMGYKNISLLGCDFNSFASTTRNHCYKDKSDARLYPMWEELFAYSFAAKDHTDLQVIAERKGVSIINSTKGSLIDAYPKEIEEELYFHE